VHSGFEQYLVEILYKFKGFTLKRDRAVLVGAALSFAPFFPSCFFGVVLSLINAVMIAKGRTRPNELPLVLASIVVGCINFAIWIYLISHINTDFSWLLSACINFISAILYHLEIIPNSDFFFNSISV
jgi:hypothetical protein